MATEKRLIDANALDFEPDSDCVANGVLIWGGRGGKTMTTVLAALKKMVDNAPTVDAVEVVRCKDCRHCKYQDEDDDRGDCDIHDTWTTRTPESFCSFGERRPDDH